MSPVRILQAKHVKHTSDACQAYRQESPSMESTQSMQGKYKNPKGAKPSHQGKPTPRGRKYPKVRNLSFGDEAQDTTSGDEAQDTKWK